MTPVVALRVGLAMRGRSMEGWHALAVCGGGSSMGDTTGGAGLSTRTARVVQLIDDEPRRPGEPAGMVGRLHRLCAALAARQQA